MSVEWFVAVVTSLIIVASLLLLAFVAMGMRDFARWLFSSPVDTVNTINSLYYGDTLDCNSCFRYAADDKCLTCGKRESEVSISGYIPYIRCYDHVLSDEEVRDETKRLADEWGIDIGEGE